MHVLFVCTAAVCRSPLAERLAAAWADDLLGPEAGGLSFASAGVEPLAGRKMDPYSAAALRRLGGVPTGDRARGVTADDLQRSVLVLTMTRQQRQAVLRTAPRGLRYTFTLREARALLELADLDELLCMTPAARAEAIGPRLDAHRARRLSTEADDIEDPRGRRGSVHERVARSIAEALRPLVLVLATGRPEEPARRSRASARPSVAIPGARDEGASPAAQGWYARMERQSAPPPSGGPPPSGTAPPSGIAPPSGTPPPSGTAPTGGAPAVGAPPGGPPTAVLPPQAPAGRFRLRDRQRTPPPGGARSRPPGRKGNRDLVLWAIGALVLGVAAVVAILFRDDLRGTSTAGSEGTTATDGAERTGSPSTAPGEDPGTPTDTVLPTDTAVPTTGTPTSSSTADDPLGIGVPMTPPACDGSWIVVVASAVDPAAYAADVTAGLSTDPSAKYVLTQGQCASLRQSTADGGQIYAVYLGPYPDQASACSASTGVGNGAYVKRMDATTPPEQTWEC